ncbi:LGFP repeat-containing protein [Brevibacterium sanguinis]|uniref:LGFP repeat-containing protein n=2 Tax=Brevibacterium TaxID=1696 RepID=A0A366ILM0_9MICO|nr:MULTISPECIES: NlpC/P60 family protein [Brevibacterium]RBP66130.1 LGFP repeat-containing protein [Brevibacterium sanguinis]RBP72781.1 LGFP repeat-containing protein [Brevibacterium celere]
MKLILPTVAGCASVALVGTLAVTAPSAFAATVEPEVTQEALSVSEEGLKVPGARDSADSSGQVSNRSATSNLPNIFKSQTALASTQVAAAPVAATGTATVTPASASLTGPQESTSPAPTEGSTPEESGAAEAPTAPAEDEKDSAESKDGAEEKSDGDISGSVQQKTEDGVNIALISDVLDVPTKNPSLIGFTFSQSQSNIRIQVRIKDESGWNSWTTLDEEQGEESSTEGSEPFTVNDATGVQMRILGDQAPSDAELVLVDPKRSAADATAVAENAPVEIDPQSTGAESDTAQLPADPGEGQAPADSGTADTASAQTAAAPAEATVTNQNFVPGSATVSTVAKSKKVPKPDIASRKSWGAKSYKGSPDYASKVKQAVVHHTAGSNSYSAEDVPSILRGIQTYHQKGRGWSDVGYNVIADKYGRLWHARGGDLEKAVVGAHVAGHNTGTFGISVLGSYGSKAPPRKARDAVASAIAWKLSLNGLKSNKSTVVAHRDLAGTDCPGDAFYAKMGEIRDTAAGILKSGELPDDGEKKDEPKEKPKPKTSIERYAEAHAKELGKATSGEYDVKGIEGGKARNYEKGVVYWSKKTGAYHLSGGIAKAYKGDVVSMLGLPIGNEKGGLKNGGTYQSFAKGAIHWSKSTGAHATSGVLLGYWKSKGYEKGHLGYPKSNPVYKDGRGEQLFEGARIVWAEGYGTTEFSPKGTIAPGALDANAPGDAGSAPPGDKAADGGSAADSGEGSADDSTADADGSEKPKDDKPKDKPKDDKSKDKPKDDKSKDKSKDKPKDKPSKDEQIQAQRDAIIKEAKKHLGVKYVWGGTSPKKGWDCSGYTQYVYGKHGIKLPRTTSQQRKAGKEIALKDAKPGDLIWVPGHIGIISETKGKMYDAGSSRTNTSKRSYEWMLGRGAKVIRVIG